jgi:hypothetical protein
MQSTTTITGANIQASTLNTTRVQQAIADAAGVPFGAVRIIRVLDVATPKRALCVDPSLLQDLKIWALVGKGHAGWAVGCSRRFFVTFPSERCPSFASTATPAPLIRQVAS